MQTPSRQYQSNNQGSPGQNSNAHDQSIANSNFKTPLQQPLLQSDMKDNSSQQLETKKTTCNCKKSQCLKLYCDCFAYGLGCSPDCNCADCANLEGNEQRKLAMDAIVERNPNAFKPKI